MVDENSHSSFIEVRKPSKLESDMLDEIERLRASNRALGVEVLQERARVAVLRAENTEQKRAIVEMRGMKARVAELEDDKAIRAHKHVELVNGLHARVAVLDARDRGYARTIADLGDIISTKEARVAELEAEAGHERHRARCRYDREHARSKAAEARVAVLESELSKMMTDINIHTVQRAQRGEGEKDGRHLTTDEQDILLQSLWDSVEIVEEPAKRGEGE